MASVFIEKGYEKTSMQDVKRATGLHPGSLYSAFENKRGMLIAVLDQYYQDRLELIDDLLKSGPTMLSGVEAYVDVVVEDYKSIAEHDCLFQKSLTEMSQQDSEFEAVVSDMMSALRRKFARLFEEMMQSGEIEAGRDSVELSDFFFVGVYGMRTLAHSNPPDGTLDNVRRQLMSCVVGKP